jgi:hypothetical protein
VDDLRLSADATQVTPAAATTRTSCDRADSRDGRGMPSSEAGVRHKGHSALVLMMVRSHGSGGVSRHPGASRHSLPLTDHAPSNQDVVDLETDGPGRAGETPWL